MANSIRYQVALMCIALLVFVSVRLARAQADGSGIPTNVDWMAQPSNCRHPSQPAHRFEIMQYKNCCYLSAEHSLSTVSRNDRSANEVVAWAVLESVRHHDKYRSVAWLALGQSHNPNAKQEILDHKRTAYEYLVGNYIAAWQNDDPERYGGTGEAFNVGYVYHRGALDGCVENDTISSIDIPTGLGAKVCDNDSSDGSDHGGAGCMNLGPGSHGVGALNDKISYVEVYREFIPVF